MQILTFQVVYTDTSTVKLTLSVVKVEEFDYSIKLDHNIISTTSSLNHHMRHQRPTSERPHFASFFLVSAQHKVQSVPLKILCLSFQDSGLILQYLGNWINST